MYYVSYGYKYIEQLVQNLSEETDHYVFIKHYNAVTLTEESLAPVVQELDGAVLLCHEYASDQIQDAFEPFLTWIRNLYFTCYSKMPAEEFVEACGIYPLHRPLFVSYLREEYCHREEDIILYEIPYERKRMNQSILAALSYIAQSHPLVLVLSSAQFSPKSTIDLLRAVVDAEPASGLGFVVSYNEVSQTMSYAQDAWRALLKSVEKKHRLIDWGTSEQQQPICPAIQFAPRLTSFHSYISMIHNMVSLLALEQANYYLDILYHKLEVERSFVAKESREQVLYLYAQTTLYLGDYAKALLLLDQLGALLDPEENSELYFACIYLSGLAHSHNGLYDMGIQQSKECLANLPKEREDYYAFKARLLEYIVIFRGFNTIFLRDFQLDDLDEFCEKAKKYHYMNHLAHVYTYAYGNQSDKELEYLQEAAKLALALDNIAFAMEIYKKNIMVVSALGNYDMAEMYYKKRIELLGIYKDPLEEANTYAGLGYNSSVAGEYEKANDYYNTAISIYYNLSKLNSTSEMLYNKTISAILAQDFEHAAVYASKCIEILEKMKMFRIVVCNTAKLHGLAALSYFRLNSDYNCSLYLASTKRYVSHLLDCTDETRFYLWDDDLFLYYFVSGLLNKKAKEYSYAQSDFDHAYYHMMRSPGNLFFCYHQFAAEQAELYQIMGKGDARTKILEKCIAYNTEHGQENQAYLAKCALEGTRPDYSAPDLGMGDVTLEMIDEQTKQLAAQAELKRKEQHIEFLATCQDMISQEQEKASLIQTTMIHIQNHFLLDQIILLSEHDGKLETFYSAEEFSLADEQIEQIVAKLTRYPRGFLVSRMEKRYEEFRELTDIFGTNRITTLLCIPLMQNNTIRSIMIGVTWLKENFTSDITILTEGEVTVLRFSFKQLVDSIDRIDANQKILEYNNELQDMNKKLQRSAVTDVLTGLLNRQGFMKLVNPEELRGKKHKEEGPNLTILYIDLDSFKYYNDTFGHAVGDLVLVNFANILKKIAGKDGYAVRYGGDEFLLVMPELPIEQAERCAKSIYRRLERQNYFIDQIPHEEGTTLDIPEEHRISCSIGIACTDFENGCTVNDTLKHADETLYYVKKHGKRTYRFWGS